VLIVDTGVLVAATDRTDRQHHRCVALLDADPGPLVTTAMVIAECAYLIERELGTTVEATLYQTILDGALEVEDLNTADWARVQGLVTAYADRPAAQMPASSRSQSDSARPAWRPSIADTSLLSGPPTAKRSSSSPDQAANAASMAFVSALKDRGVGRHVRWGWQRHASPRPTLMTPIVAAALNFFATTAATSTFQRP